MLLIFKVTVPLLVKGTVCAVDVDPTSCKPKMRLAALRSAVGTPPVPLREIVCGLPLASSAMLMVAVRAPVALGVKVTSI